jgi:hypothetical protein
MKKFIMELLFGKITTPIPHNTGIRTSYPQERPTFDEWCKQLKVSCLHGKSIVCMD